ncbi:Avirulence (Avh) protein [Phytophthora megakarya]|uniref:Avirulence (Avh) protein n=1 Tax=Phytophthora megakarya TaxID=4795 RepID=A0A225VGR7_9STRA|nr:Avirulence (Avh) protein [Phytophthora megakarya]
MVKDEAYRLKMFQNWIKHKQSYVKIKERMFLELNPQFRPLLKEYSSKFALQAAQVKKVKTSTAENVKMVTTRVRDPSKPVKRVRWADHQGGTLNELAKDPVPL